MSKQLGCCSYTRIALSKPLESSQIDTWFTDKTYNIVLNLTDNKEV